MHTTAVADFAPGFGQVKDNRAARFVEDVCSLHDGLRFTRLVAAVERSSLECYVTRRHGVVTVAVRTCDIPNRYLLGVLGFRLAEYLRVGYASRGIAAKRALFSEPPHILSPDDWHVISLSEETGEILGYVEMVGREGGFTRLHAVGGGTAMFPVEQAHGVDLLSAFDAEDRHARSGIREVKRFLHRRSLTDRALRLRVSLECLLTLGRVVGSEFPGITAIIGDAESDVALRHVVLLGLDVRVLVGTAPSLPDDDLMHPAYVTRTDVKPFFAEVPALEEIQRRAAVIDRVLDNSDVFAEVALLAEEMQGSVEDVPLVASAA